MKSRVNPNRRDWLRATGLGATGVTCSGWLGRLAAAASTSAVSRSVQAEPGVTSGSSDPRTKSVIVLWLAGGPSTIDLWDLKPGHANGGPIREIASATPGMRFSEHLPNLAKLSEEIILIRSLASREGDHGRATRFLQTGYLPGAGIAYPPLGSLISRETGRTDADLPNFISIAPSRSLTEPGGGFLGPHYAPLVVGRDATSAEDLTVPNMVRSEGVSESDQRERLKLLNLLEQGSQPWRKGPVTESVRTAASRALRLMHPSARAAFRLDEEKSVVRDAYGRSAFGQGCLLARRLVERHVPFVEVTLGGWDTHYDNFERVPVLSRILDVAYAALIRDLRERGLLESTLIVCQGEFGRTPKINGSSGRDHWPQSWAVSLAGGGIRGGQIIGKTSPDGTEVIEQRATVPDLIATVCKSVGIDPRKQNNSNVGRPIRIADPAAKEIAGIL